MTDDLCGGSSKDRRLAWRRRSVARSLLAAIALVLLLFVSLSLSTQAQRKPDDALARIQAEQPSARLDEARRSTETAPEQVMQTSDEVVPPLSLAWSSSDVDFTRSVAWGDYDGDGDLDLAVGNEVQRSKLYRNNGGVLTTNAVWWSEEVRATYTLAWGDCDRDGDLDLALGNSNQSNQLLRNDGISPEGAPIFTLVWSSYEEDDTRSIAWGDYDGDGNLDLAVGNWNQVNRLYRGAKCALSEIAIWSSEEMSATKSLAWGDYDGDGWLDLAVGNVGEPNQLYHNIAGTLGVTAAWESSEADYTRSVAWGDYDGDGDLDLAAGNNGHRSRLYRNEAGTLTHSAYWSTPVETYAESVAWGDFDGDGDLDLAVGITGRRSQLYRNEAGTLTILDILSSVAHDMTTSVAWGDYDGDGDLDLASGSFGQQSRLLRNDRGSLSDSASWSSPGMSITLSMAWGDYDGDGDLDLAVGNWQEPNCIYSNENGVLATNATWSSDEIDQTTSLAWGDSDGDGDLDLAVGNKSGPNQLYRNDGLSPEGTPIFSLAWTSLHEDATRSIAWGDYDGDGDLDLAVGNDNPWSLEPEPNRLYRNDNGELTRYPFWSSDEVASTYSVAWGDYDGDGDLDLAAGNKDGPNRLYRNDRGLLITRAVWSAIERDETVSVAWGDYDGDGDLDLAAGNYRGPNRLYRNDNGTLTSSAVWSSLEVDWTNSVAWGDYDNDGDIDLAVSNQGGANRVYRNDHGTLAASAAWSSVDVSATNHAAWGDFDGDGDLDLAAGNEDDFSRLYVNIRNTRLHVGLPGDEVAPLVRLASIDDAAGYSDQQVWPVSGSSIPISYVLSHPDSRPVSYVRAWYSLDGGGAWRPAVASAGTITASLATSPSGIEYVYDWNVLASGFFGRSDNVVFRIEAVPDLRPANRSVPGPFLYGSNASDTYPFRVRGTQVRVIEEGKAVARALAYRQPVGESGQAVPIAGLSGEPFRTDDQGYLQGRGAISPGDRVFALAPITATSSYTLYHTNATPTAAGLDGATITQTGVLTLEVSASHPLVLFNLDVSLEWDARGDEQFLAQLRYDLQRTSEFLFDWTNGQAALGSIRIYHDAKRQPEVDGWQPWLDSHIRIYASNRLRPNASQGGIVSEAISETVPIAASTVITYTPGQVHMGPVWNRYGDSDGSLGEDWPRTLAHELGHFAFFQEDNYLGLDAGGLLVPVEGCPSVMSDPYRDDWSEFHPDDATWQTDCTQTLSQQLLGRSDWGTIELRYPWLSAAPENPGPSGLPLAVTQIEVVEPADSGTALEVPIFYLTQDGHRVQPGQSARAFLFQGDWATDLGRPALDQVNARGAAAGDLLCVYELSAGRLGCEVATKGDEQLALVATEDWQPSVTVTPVTTRTFEIAVANVPSGLSLRARLYPVNAPADAEITLEPTAEGYGGIIATTEPAFEGYVQVWVDGSEPRQAVIVDYALGGGPGYRRSEGGYRRSEGGYRRSEGAPVMSPDGQVMLFMDEDSTGEYWFYTLQALPTPPQPPLWATAVGQAYRLSASPDAPDLAGASISVSYLGSEVPPGEEAWLRLYFWDGLAWQPLDTKLDTYHNLASAAVRGTGVYALLSALEIPLYGPGWNLFGYPVQGTRPVTEALVSIDGYYITVYGHEPADTADPWKIYDVTVPAWVNDLNELEFGRGYWINATEAITLRLRGAAAAQTAQAADMSSPPATFYGAVLSVPGFTPAAGMRVKARIGDAVCGEALTRDIEGRIVYTVNVLADGPALAAGCGAPGRTVHFDLETRPMATVAAWNNNRVQAVALSMLPVRPFYLPLLYVKP